MAESLSHVFPNESGAAPLLAAANTPPPLPGPAAEPRTAWSVVIATRNRREALLETLRAVPASFEVIVVDNASTDRTPEAVYVARPSARVVALRRNAGPVAKTLALPMVSNELVAALDDDAAPEAWTWDEMASRFGADGRLLCAGWGVRTPVAWAREGKSRPAFEGWDCGALPRVFAGAACAFRTGALRAVGGWDVSLFMQAEEYDLVFRLCALAGESQACGVCFDLPATHRKSPLARSAARTLRLDARNNAIVARRWLPEPWGAIYGADWRDRYRALARMAGHRWSAPAGRLQALARRWAPTALAPGVFDDLFGHAFLIERMTALRDTGVRRVLLARRGKNALAFDIAARRAGLEIMGLADDRFAGARGGGVRWRGTAVVREADATREPFDAVVIADSAPIHAAHAAARWRERTNAPVHAPHACEPSIVAPRAGPDAGASRAAA